MAMKLHYNSVSPYVRKVVVTAVELELDREIDRVQLLGSLWVGESDEKLAHDNPLAKIPTLITQNGTALIDSTLICEYLSSLNPEAGLLPQEGPER